MNAIISMKVNGVQVEGVEGVKCVVFNHFCNHFLSPSANRSRFEDLTFKSISGVEGTKLIRSFSVEKIKQELGIVIVSKVQVRMILIWVLLRTFGIC